MGMGRQRDVGQCAGQERMLELASAMQRIGADGALEAAHIVHQPETQRLHTRVGRDGMHLGQCGRALDQHLERDGRGQPQASLVLLAQGAGRADLGHAANLGQREIGQPMPGMGHQRVQFSLETAMKDRMGTRAYPVEAIVRRIDGLGHPQGVAQLVSGGCAILAVGRDVQHRAQSALKGQRLGQQRRTAAVMVADGQHRPAFAFPIQDGSGGTGGGLAAHGAQPSRCLTPLRSPSSSSSVAFMRSRLKASMSRPLTIVYSPFWQVTGMP